MNRLQITLFIAGIIAMSACQTTSEEFEVTSKSVDPGSGITWLGNQTPLLGSEKLRVGAKLPDISLTNLKMEQTKIATPGRVKIINTIPSIDTPVCDRQTHVLGEAKSLNPSIERVTISLDLPYAQRRFVEETKLENINFYSDYRGNEFAHLSGLQIQRNGLLARSVMVVDQNGIVRHLQVVPEITQMPDMDKAFAIANQLAQSESK